MFHHLPKASKQSDTYTITMNERQIVEDMTVYSVSG